MGRTTIKLNLLPKQTTAFKLYLDEQTTELGYGGAAGGGKTKLGCLLALYIAHRYPGSRCGIGRKELKNLKRTTLVSLFEEMRDQGLKDGVDFKYNQQDSIIKFLKTESEIVLFDTANQPSDPLFTRFGSYELTWAWIDESNETPVEAVRVLKTRVGRKNRFNGKDVKPFFLETFNPNKGHVYHEYYKPFRDNTLPSYRNFVRALPGDNPFLPAAYLENLKRADKVTRERLLNGNFEYDDDPYKLMPYDKILELWSNDWVSGGENYLSCDIAMQGSDKFVICVWEGLRLKKIYTEDKSTGKGIEDKIRGLAALNQVPQSNIVFDNDGVGSYLGSYLDLAQPFVNNSKALNTENYRNLKSQCYYKLSELVNSNKIHIEDTSYRETIIEELDQIKNWKPDNDGKLEVTPKEEIKENLSRSPDFADAIMMRCFWEVETVIDYERLWAM